MKYHEYANLFPMMPEADLMRLAEDIKEKGLSDSIVTLDGKILDGRNRYKACDINGIDPRFEEYTGDDPLGYVVSHNLHRRHLDESQRGMVAARLSNMRQGERTDIRSNDLKSVSQDQAAAMLNVSVPTLKRSKRVLNQGIQELQDMQESGEISASAASTVASLPKDEQRKAVAGGVAGVKDAAKKLSLKKQSGSAKSASLQSTDLEKTQPETSLLPPPDSAKKTKFKVIQTSGMATYAAAKQVMETLHKNDTEWGEALEAMISYCQNRLNTKR